MGAGRAAGVAARALGARSAAWQTLEDRAYWRMQRAVERVGLPEVPLLWSLAVRRTARGLARGRNVRVVVTSGPPHSVHAVGLHLKRRLGLPWIADLRDPITSNFGYRPAHRLADAWWRRLERAIVGSADRVVVTCDALAADLAQRHAPRRAERFVTITNGHDPVDAPPRAAPPPADFGLSYVGALYRGQPIEPVLCGCRRFLAEHPSLTGRFRLRITGSISAGERRAILPVDGEYLVHQPYRTHAVAVAEMHAAAALLLVVPDHPGGRLCIPAKTFEYLATDRPVLALVPQGSSVARLLERAGGVELLHRYDAAAFAAGATRLYRRWQRTPTVARDAQFLRETRRDLLAGRLAELLTESIDRPVRARLAAAAPRTDAEAVA
ncbi:MAG: glycosyltransferase [Phycisphaerae bacterium]